MSNNRYERIRKALAMGLRRGHGMGYSTTAAGGPTKRSSASNT